MAALVCIRRICRTMVKGQIRYLGARLFPHFETPTAASDDSAVLRFKER
jgi:hypothetical protein